MGSEMCIRDSIDEKNVRTYVTRIVKWRSSNEFPITKEALLFLLESDLVIIE